MKKFQKADFVKPEENYVRVGVDYFKVLSKPDRYDIIHTELKKWKKEEIVLDHGRKFLENLQKYDDFVMWPNNINYTNCENQFYNLYAEFPHKPKKGNCDYSKSVISHIFGSQAMLGIRYMQALYLHPERMLPILVLVSRERQTGKTTFINWLNMIFGANMVMINPDDLINSFNASYATANIIAVEETLIEKSLTVEKIKALATGKYISVNQKFISQYKLPFYGKIILASNNEDRFAPVEEEEIRFFVRGIKRPAVYDHDIETKLLKEIPAFLQYLTELPPIDWSRDRSGFTPEELHNEFLTKVKKESRSGLYKDITEQVVTHFNNMSEPMAFKATPIDIKEKWFGHIAKIEPQYIRRVLRNEFHIEPEELQRYNPFGETMINKVGRPFTFDPELFNIDIEAIKSLETVTTPF